MADTSAASSSADLTPSSSSQQAGPLPTKRGEIGFREDLHAAEEGRASTPLNLPARHPADRDSPPSADNDHPHDSSNASPNSDTAAAAAPPTTPRPADVTSTTSERRRRFLKFFNKKKIPAYGGLLLTTLLAFTVQVSMIGATIAGWAITINKVNAKGQSSASQMAGASSSIFIHVVFAIAVLGQLIFLERRLFMLRAQRYSFKHPGQILPSSRYVGMGDDPIVAWSPWNRPPLPTYAAALAQSGVGTGDVEDHIIAQPPPPAYGNTRGSTLILQGFLNQNQRSQRPVSVHSNMSQVPRERPVSYRSTDSGWVEIQDAQRARQLEETLSQLERTPSNASSASQPIARPERTVSRSFRSDV